MTSTTTKIMNTSAGQINKLTITSKRKTVNKAFSIVKVNARPGSRLYTFKADDIAESAGE